MISKDIIEQLAAEELVDANTRHEPKFNSLHEAYAVILEEVEEMKSEMNDLEFDLKAMWHLVMVDSSCKDSLLSIRRDAIHAIQEGLQVLAMADKALKLYETEA